jgi:chromosome segregation protein
LEIHNQTYKESLTRLSSAKERYQQKLYQQEWNRQQENKLKSELNQVLESSDKTKKEMMEIERQKKTSDTKIKNLQIEIIENQKILGSIEKNTVQTTALYNKIQNNIKIVSSRMNFFEQVITKYEGYPKSTQTLMQARDKFPGLIAPLSELIKVEDKYQVAIERALGEAVHYIIVENVSLAKQLIKYVYDQKIGRITLLPLDRVEKLPIANRRKTISAICLSELISCEEKYHKIFDILLGETFLTDDFNQALDIAKKHPGLRLVSIKGEMIDGTQAITGGDHTDSKNLLIGRKEQLKQFQFENEQLQEEEKQIVQKLKKI